MNKTLDSLASFIRQHNGINDKRRLCALVMDKFKLTRDRSVYYCKDTALLDATITLKHWSGRNSRGVTQFEGKAIGELIQTPQFAIDPQKAVTFLRRIIAL